MPKTDELRIKQDLFSSLQPLGEKDFARRVPNARQLNYFFTADQLNEAATNISIITLKATLLPKPTILSSFYEDLAEGKTKFNKNRQRKILKISRKTQAIMLALKQRSKLSFKPPQFRKNGSKFPLEIYDHDHILRSKF